MTRKAAQLRATAGGICLLLIAFLLPFERIGSVDIAGATVRPSQLVVLLSFVAVFFGFLAHKSRHIPRNPITWPVVGFAIVAIVGLFNAPNLDRSLTVLAFQVFTIGIAFVVPFQLRSREQLPLLLKWLLAGTAVVTLFGIFQFVGDWIGLPTSLTGLRDLYTKDVLGFPRVQSTALEPLYFANYLLIPLSVLLALFLRREKSLPEWLVSGLLGLVVINLLLTVARGAYIAAVPAVLLVSAVYARQLFTRRILGVAAGLVIAGMMILSQLTSFSVFTQNFAGHVTNLFGGASYVERVDMFVVAIDAWEQHPWVGIGSGSFGPFEASSPFFAPREGWKIVNNEYIELLAENGVLGLGAMLAAFAIVLLRSLKALRIAHDPLHKAVLVGMSAALVGILVQYNTFSILYIVHIWFVVGVLIALQNMVLDRERR
jgi:O-antigen ligase